MSNLKEPLTYEQQIDRLQNFHNLIINNEEEAKNILQKVNYYRLSAYGIGLKKSKNSEEYVDGTTLEDLYRLYKFDSRFRNILIHIIEQLEIQLRSQISYHIAIQYGAEGYMNKEIFQKKYNKNNEEIYENIIKSFRQECEHQKNTPFVKHHRIKYDNHFPIWVAVELLTFGNLSSLYSIMKNEDKQSLAKLYHTKPAYLNGWILALVEIRNICAHYGRIYNMPLKQSPYLYSEYARYKNSEIKKIFPVVITIRRMLNNNELWKSFFAEMTALFDEYSDVINLSFVGFPKDWKEVLDK
ncbi:MAG: Abi family protein [Acutalibacteraceae bacterium]